MSEHTAEQLEIIGMVYDDKVDAADLLRKIRAHDGLVNALDDAMFALSTVEQTTKVAATKFRIRTALAALKATGSQS